MSRHATRPADFFFKFFRHGTANVLPIPSNLRAMKAKNHTRRTTGVSKCHKAEEILPFELGTHLFAMIRRNITAKGKAAPSQDIQLTFAL